MQSATFDQFDNVMNGQKDIVYHESISSPILSDRLHFVTYLAARVP
jgi:hypothetical protein